MSLARIYVVPKSIKEFNCSKCGKPIPKGSKVIKFAVGFRGYEQKRHAECSPSRAERESSAIAACYAAQDEADVAGCESLADLEGVRDAVAEAFREVQSEYEDNAMYDVNEDLQERASTLESAADELENWSPEEDEPEEPGECKECDGTGTVANSEPTEDCEACGGTGTVKEDDWTDRHNEWLEAAKASLQEAIDGMETP